MVFVDGQLLGLLLKTDLHCLVAARTERAALRQIEYVDGRTGDGDELFLHVVDIRDGAKQTLGILLSLIHI